MNDLSFSSYHWPSEVTALCRQKLEEDKKHSTRLAIKLALVAFVIFGALLVIFGVDFPSMEWFSRLGSGFLMSSSVFNVTRMRRDRKRPSLLETDKMAKWMMKHHFNDLPPVVLQIDSFQQAGINEKLRKLLDDDAFEVATALSDETTENQTLGDLIEVSQVIAEK